MGRPTKQQRLEKAGINIEGQTKEQINAAYLDLPADGKVRKDLLKFGIDASSLSGKEAIEKLKELKGQKPSLIDKAYKVEVDPDKRQIPFIHRCCGISRKIHNLLVENRKEFYLENKKYPKTTELGSKITADLNEGKLPSYLKTLPAASRNIVIKGIDSAVSSAFKKINTGTRPSKAGFPKKHCRKRHGSYGGMNANEARVIVDKGHEYIKVPKMPGLLRVKETGYLPLDIIPNSYSVSFNAGRYYVSLTYRETRPEERGTHSHGEVGIDPNIKTALVLSDGTIYEAPRPLLEATAKLRRIQRAISRAYEARKLRNGTVGKKAKGPIGSNENELRNKLAKQYAIITRIRRDWQNKVSISIVKRYSVIRVQTGIQGWIKSAKGTGVNVSKTAARNRKILDIGLGEIFREIKYKSDWYGSIYEEVDKYFPSTQLCSNPDCGKRTGPKDLSTRSWICPECGTKHDRDRNSAINIKDFPLWSQNDHGEWHRADRSVKTPSNGNRDSVSCQHDKADHTATQPSVVLGQAARGGPSGSETSVSGSSVMLQPPLKGGIVTGTTSNHDASASVMLKSQEALAIS